MIQGHIWKIQINKFYKFTVHIALLHIHHKEILKTLQITNFNVLKCVQNLLLTYSFVVSVCSTVGFAIMMFVSHQVTHS